MAAPLVPYLANIKRWILLLYLAGFASFLAIVWALDRFSAPGTPANQLVTGRTGWLFVLPGAILVYGVYVSIRWWRCPSCGLSLPTKFPVPDRCKRCGEVLRK